MNERLCRVVVGYRRSACGFTLVEVMVALLIMAVMAGMAWQGVDGITRARETSSGQVDRMLRLDTVIAQWEQDLYSIEDSQVVPALAFDGSTLRLTRRGNAGMLIVAWSLRGNTLTRWVSNAATGTRALQESWMRSLQLIGTEPEQLRTLVGVNGWQIYFFRNNGWTNAQSSGDVAPVPLNADDPATAAPRTLLPTGVRLMLSFAPGSGLNGTMTRDIRLPPQSLQ